MKNPEIGSRVRFINDSNDVVVDLFERKGVSTVSKFEPRRVVRGCAASRPTRFTVSYDLEKSQGGIRDTFDLELTPEQLLAHEFGHFDYEYEAWLNGDIPSDDASNFRGVLWENYFRDLHHRRMSHEVIDE